MVLLSVVLVHFGLLIIYGEVRGLEVDIRDAEFLFLMVDVVVEFFLILKVLLFIVESGERVQVKFQIVNRGDVAVVDVEGVLELFLGLVFVGGSEVLCCLRELLGGGAVALMYEVEFEVLFIFEVGKSCAVLSVCCLYAGGFGEFAVVIVIVVAIFGVSWEVEVPVGSLVFGESVCWCVCLRNIGLVILYDVVVILDGDDGFGAVVLEGVGSMLVEVLESAVDGSWCIVVLLLGEVCRVEVVMMLGMDYLFGEVVVMWRFVVRVAELFGTVEGLVQVIVIVRVEVEVRCEVRSVV